MEKRFVYEFRSGAVDGRNMKGLLGGKGAALLEMCALNIAVPPGFTITTEACKLYYDHRHTLHHSLVAQIRNAVKSLETFLGREFGSTRNPLLISIRSGAVISMPGMMDTILNLGLNDVTVKVLAKETNNPHFAYDSYRRFIQMYGNIALGIDAELFEHVLDKYKKKARVNFDHELSVATLQSVIKEYKKIISTKTKQDFPQDVYTQLWNSIKSVFSSWMNPRAIKYREIHKIADDLYTAVNVQAMVFGNMGEDSATGVVFTRNPSSGEKELFGEFLVNAQGEDVVAGIRDTMPLTTNIKGQAYCSNHISMEQRMPKVFGELYDICKALELHYKDMQDVEFTVEQGKLWILQARNGKRTATAALQIAFDMANEGSISIHEALLKLQPELLEQLLYPSLDDNYSNKILTKGLPASPGAAVGVVVFSAQQAEIMAVKHAVILVRSETSPDDISGMNVAQGILTARGGMTSHAAVIARGMGKPCVCSAADLVIDYAQKKAKIKGVELYEGETITINGSTGEVILGAVATIKPAMPSTFYEVMAWTNTIQRLDVYANADTEKDAITAISLGAEGIGLCRTEHMFFAPERIVSVRKMILAHDKKNRQDALKELIVYQKEDFKKIFGIMGDLPVTIRLLDPPLHEFLPRTQEEIQEFCEKTKSSMDEVQHQVRQLTEYNPMLGHRGCRLAITFPEIYEMQIEAIFTAILELKRTSNSLTLHPEIMIPLVIDKREVIFVKMLINNVLETLARKNPLASRISYGVGAMIELPRAVLQADAIGKVVDFLSFGTNDLTQTTLGISRDDSDSFIGAYMDAKILDNDPFITLDKSGVGTLMEIAVAKARSVNANIKLGICGEHGGDPASIEFCHNLGLDYVSCSPYRIPVARLAAARAALSPHNIRKMQVHTY
ncbi:Pyruvate, phosphate dikinase [Alphaproteobacteria bacterium]